VWSHLNTSLSDNLTWLLIGDLDRDGAADIICFDAINSTWQVSWGGKTGWQQLTTMSSSQPGARVWGYVGRFGSPAGAGLLALDTNRQSFLYTRASGSLAPYGLYHY